MKERGLIKKDSENKMNTMYVEYGAGRAGLSSFVAQSLKSLSEESRKQVSFLIVDKDRRRYKHDKDFKDEFKVFREKIDIADFDLETFLKEKQGNNEIRDK